MKIKLINVGRANVTYETEVKDDEAMYKEVCKNLLSNDVEMESEDGIHFGVYAGFHKVGDVEIIKS